MHLICHKTLQKTRILLQCNMSGKNREDKMTIDNKNFDLNSFHMIVLILRVSDQICEEYFYRQTELLRLCVWILSPFHHLILQ